MAGIFDGIKKALTTNPLKGASETGDQTPAAPAYKPPAEDPASALARNTAATTDKAAALERARKQRQKGAASGAQKLVDQMRDNF